MPADWKRAKVGELHDWAEDLGIDLDNIRGSGRNGAIVRHDIVNEIDEVAGIYRKFFERMDRAHLEGETKLVEKLSDVAYGKVEETREYQEPRIEKDDDGNEVEVWVPVRRIITRSAPDGQALRFLLERRHDRWNRRRPNDTSSASNDPQSVARDIRKALAEMDKTVPGFQEDEE